MIGKFRIDKGYGDERTLLQLGFRVVCCEADERLLVFVTYIQIAVIARADGSLGGKWRPHVNELDDVASLRG